MIWIKRILIFCALLFGLAFFTFKILSKPKKLPPNKGIAVNTDGSEIPYLIIDVNQKAIQDEPKIKGSLFSYEKNILKYEIPIGIEYRGKTSFLMSDKKSFGFETRNVSGKDSSVSFYDMPPDEDWLLIGNVYSKMNGGQYFDSTMMYHYIGYEIARKTGQYAARSKWVELQIDGAYQGLYLLMEKLKRSDDRIALQAINKGDDSLSGGYIIIIDKGNIKGENRKTSRFGFDMSSDATYTAANSFRSKYDYNGTLLKNPPYGPPFHELKSSETYFMYEYPSQEKISMSQKKYIQQYIHDFETSLLRDDFSKGDTSYHKYIDIPSFVDYFLINELCFNIDAYRLSTYLTKEKGGKLSAGPVWDMNIGFDEGKRVPQNDWIINYNKHVEWDMWMLHFWYPRMMKDPFFRKAVKLRWSELRQNEFKTDHLLSLVDSTSNFLIKNGAVQRNFQKWDNNFALPLYKSKIGRLKKFIETRAAWMDQEIDNF